MKRVFVAENPFEAKLVKDLLEAAGIESIVRGDYLFSLRGGLPLTADTLPSVWVVHDEDVGRAEGVLEQQQQRSMFRCIDGDGEGGAVEEAGEESEGWDSKVDVP